MDVLFCEHCLSIMIGLLHVMKRILEFIDLHMQIADLPLHAFIGIDFNAIDECRTGALHCVLDVRMQ